MTTLTIAPTTGPFDADPDYCQGRADAYDDSHTRTVDQMVVLLSMAVDHAPVRYAQGYAARVTELRLELDVVAAAESELAQTWLARKQGRETSTLHTGNRAHTWKGRRS